MFDSYEGGRISELGERLRCDGKGGDRHHSWPTNWNVMQFTEPETTEVVGGRGAKEFSLGHIEFDMLKREIHNGEPGLIKHVDQVIFTWG